MKHPGWLCFDRLSVVYNNYTLAQKCAGNKELEANSGALGLKGLIRLSKILL